MDEFADFCCNPGLADFGSCCLGWDVFFDCILKGSLEDVSLTTCRLKLSLNYVLKLKSLPKNPAYSCVFEPENTKLFEASESKVPPLGIRIIPHLEKSKLNLNLVDAASLLDIIPWKLSVPVVRFDLTSFKKDTTNPEIYKQLCLQLISEYSLSDFFFHQRF